MPAIASLPNTIAAAKPAIHRASNGHYYAAPPDQATANKYASLYEAIISNPAKWQSFSTGMSQTNPTIFLGNYDKSIQGLQSASYPEPWYAHTTQTMSSGSRIANPTFTAYYEMQADHTSASYTDPAGFTATSWKEWVSKQHWHDLTVINQQNTNAPANMIYFDSMGQKIGGEISWQDGHAYTVNEWLTITATIPTFAKTVKPSTGLWIAGNGLRGGPSYMGSSTDPTAPNGSYAQLANDLDIGLAESALRNNFDAANAWPANAEVEQNINMNKSMALRKKICWNIINIQNFDASPGHAAISFTVAQANNWRRYTMAVYLLGNDGYSFYEFVENTNTVLPWNETHPWYSVILGLPLDNKANAAAYKDPTTGLYIRNYEQGTIYLNNTTAAITFTAPAGYTGVDGTAVTSVTVGPHDAILLKHPLQSGGGGSGGGGSQAAQKAPIQGLSKAGITGSPTTYVESAYINSISAITLYVYWDQLQPTSTSLLDGTDVAAINNAITWCRNNSKELKLRIFCGSRSPAWLKTSAGVFYSANNQDMDPVTGAPIVASVPKFWTTTFLTAYDNLMKLMAAQWDTIDVLRDVTVSALMTRYAEPFIRDLGGSVTVGATTYPVGNRNRAELVGGGTGWAHDGTANAGSAIAAPGAGYSDAANQAAHKTAIDSHSRWWVNTNSSFAFNPYQVLLSSTEAGVAYGSSGDNQVFDSNDDATLSKTKSIMDYFKTSLGDRGILENNSVRSSYFTYDATGKATGIATPTAGYGLMYTYITQYGPNSFFQTANSTNIGDFNQTMDGIVNILKGNGVEPPVNYNALAQAGDPAYSAANLDKYDTLLQGNPITAIAGGGGGGGTGGTYTETNVVTDSYTRNVAAGGLGTADTGQAYTLTGTATEFSVPGTVAQVVTTAAGRGHIAMVNGVSVTTQAHAKARFTWNELPVGDDQIFYVWLRADSTGQNGYRVRCIYNVATQTIQMRLQKVVANVATSIGTLQVLSIPWAANVVLAAELYAIGTNPTTLQGYLYRDADGVPAVPTDSTPDSEPSLQNGSGTTGWSTFVQANNTNFPVNTTVLDFAMGTLASTTQNAAPIISTVQPSDGTSIQIASGKTSIGITAQATATDSDGTVVGVTVKVGSGAEQALTLSGGVWSRALTLTAGNYTLTWTATDDQGATAVVTTTLTVLAASAATTQWYGEYGADTGGGFCESFAMDENTPGQYSAGGDTWGFRVTTSYGNYWDGSQSGIADGQRQHGRATFFSKRQATSGVRFYGHGVNSSGGKFYYALPNSLVVHTLDANNTFALGLASNSGPNNYVRRACGQLIDSWYKASTDIEMIFTVTRAGLKMYKNNVASGTAAARITGMAAPTLLCDTTAAPTGINNRMRQFVEVLDDTHLVVINAGFDDSNTSIASQVYVVTTSATDWSGATAANTTSALQTIGAPKSRVYEIHRGKDNVLYAACGYDGVYTCTLSGGSLTWTHISQQGGSEFFDRLVCSVDAASDGTVWVGQAGSNNGPTTLYDGSSGGGMVAGHSIGVRKSGTWSFTGSQGTGGNVDFHVFTYGDTTNGTGGIMWIRTEPTMLGDVAHDTSMIRVDPFNDQFVTLVGRAGCWQTRDRGSTWHPAMFGMNGGQMINSGTGQHPLVTAQGNNVYSYNTDYNGAHSTDSMKTAVELGSYVPTGTGTDLGATTSWIGQDGKSYKFIAATATAPAQLFQGTTKISDAKFEGAIFLSTAACTTQDGTVIITQDGGASFCMRFGIPPDPSSGGGGGGGGGSTDVTPPVLTVTTPSANATVPNATTSQTVAGIATDDVGVTLLTVNGVVVSPDGTGHYSTSVPLNVGSNQITVQANDLAGNQTTVIRTITRQDVVVTNNPPTVSLVAPTDGQIYPFGTAVEIQGSANDPDGTIATVSYAIDGADPVNMGLTIQSGGVGQTVTFDVSLTLPAGNHTIIVTATDSGGLTASTLRNIVTQADTSGGGGGGTGGGVTIEQVTDLSDVVDPDPTPTFTVVHSLHDGRDLGDSKASALRFGKFIGAAGYVSYDLNRSDALAAEENSEPNMIDFALQRNGVELLTGEIVERDADTNTDMVSITGNDWMNYLDQIYLPFDPANPQSSDNFTMQNADLRDITQGLINKVLNAYDFTIDLSMNNIPTGILQSQHFSAYDLNSLKSMIDTLAQQNPGFEWEITHDMQFIMYSPKRTDQSLYRVDRSNILQVHYGKLGIQAAWVYGRGQGAGSASAIRKAGNADVARVYRDRVAVVDFGTVSSRKVLDNLTRQKVADFAKQKLEFWIIVQPRQNENVYGAVFPGQYVYIDWNDTYISLNGYYRLMGYETVVDESGNEQITMNFNTDDASVN